MKPELDGTGGGFGKFQGMTVADTAHQFERWVAEGKWRGLSGVLRVAREQIEARGALGSYRWVAILALVALAGFGAWLPVATPETHDFAQKGVLTSAILAVLFGVGAITNHRNVQRGVAQEREIRRLAVDALARIVRGEGFRPKELDRLQAITLRDLLRRTKSDDAELWALLKGQSAED